MRHLVLCLVLTGMLPVWTKAQSIVANFSPGIPYVARATSAWADYDQDGDQDLFLCGVDSNGQDLAILLENKPTGFVPDPQNTFPSLRGASANWADIDGDGDPDLAFCGLEAPNLVRTLIYENQNGQLVSVSHSAPGVMDGEVIWNDFDQDGDPDLFLCGNDRRTGYRWGILENYGNLNFSRFLHELPYDFEYQSASVGDFDGDGFPDLALSGLAFPAEGQVKLLRNFGQFQFAEIGNFIRPIFLTGLHLGDLNADSKADLLITGSKDVPLSEIHCLKKGQFAKEAINLEGVHWGDALSIQIPGDTIETLVLAGRNTAGDQLLIYRPDNQGNYQLLNSANFPKLFLSKLSTADWNGDSYPDLLVTGENQQGEPRAYILTFDNGTFKP